MAEIKDATIAEIETAFNAGNIKIQEAKDYYLELKEDDVNRPLVFSQIRLMDGMKDLLEEVIRLRKELES